MPTQKLEGKGVEERMGEAEREKERERKSTRMWEREREKALWLLLLCFFLPLGLPRAHWAQPGGLFVLPEVSTPVLGPPFVLFSRAFAFLVF